MPADFNEQVSNDDGIILMKKNPPYSIRTVGVLNFF